MMGETGGEDTEQNRDADTRKPVYDVLSDPRCRRVLATLDRSGPTCETDLAAAVCADEHGGVPDEDSETERVLLELYHVSLPRLAAAGLVSWEGTTVEPRLREQFDERPEFWAFVRADRSRTLEYLKLLAVDERRAALEALSAVDHPMELSGVADSVATSLNGGSDDAETERTDERCTSLSVALHHVHLPALDRAGLVDYDHRERVVELRRLAPTATQQT